MKTHNKLISVVWGCFLSLCGVVNCFAQIHVEKTLWRKQDFTIVPKYKIVGTDSVQSIIFESLPYKGHKKNVFAYYATPGMLNGDISKDKGLPGIVLVHGGGGMAFRDWVVQWAKRGYAAIALDTRGNGPDKEHIEGGFEENGKGTPYFDVNLPLQEQWLFQAVGDVLNAHTLLLSFSAVDKRRTAITGISWGGVLTCISSSLDARFKVAVPVYGCGFLNDSGRMKQELDKLSDKERAIWMSQYDPSLYLSHMDRPILFLNGTNDVHFYLSSMVRSAALAKNSNLLIKRGLKHSHKYGWNNEEISTFINQYLCNSEPLPHIVKEKKEDYMMMGKVCATVPIENVTLYYTADSGMTANEYDWLSVDGNLYGKNWQVAVPKSARMWFVNLTDIRGLQISSKLYKR